MNVSLYVEGPSDKLGLEILFKHLIASKQEKGIRIRIFESAKGDRKDWLLRTAPIKAARTLANDSSHHVAIVPDLYPRNRVFEHTTAVELAAGLQRQLHKELQRMGNDDVGIADRFHPFCFKHDFEALLLGAEEALRAHLGVAALRCNWIRPPEDQDHERPPKRVIETIFEAHGKRYGLLEATGILRRVDYRELKTTCPQCFAPLAEFLESL